MCKISSTSGPTTECVATNYHGRFIKLRNLINMVRGFTFPQLRLELGRKAFSYFRPAFYNGLHADIKQRNSSKSFEAKIKGLLCISVKLVWHNYVNMLELTTDPNKSHIYYLFVFDYFKLYLREIFF